MSSEAEIQTQIRLKLSEMRAGMFLRYQVGKFMTLDGRVVNIGVLGASDLVGVIPHIVTAADIGKTIGVFCAIETKQVKDKTDKKRKESQAAFRRVVRSHGGVAGIARSVEDAVSLVTGKWNSEPHKK